LDLRALLSESPVQCIIVAPAYRLNLFGFLASPEISETCPDFASNLGFWDQRLALEWTHDNISCFGGNPSNITLSGYSAGSYSVFYQLAYDLSLPDEMAIAKRAIMSSNGPGTQPKSLSAAQHQFDELMEALEIPSSLSAHDKFVRLRNLDAMTLIEASTKMQQFQFRPVTDGSFVRHGLLNELSNGIFAQRMRRRNVKLMNGECSDEWYVYGTLRPPEPGYDSMLHRLKADYSHEVCEVLMTHYFPNHELSPKYESWQAAFGHVYADVQICALNRGLVNALIKHGAGELVYRYRIEWRAECVAKSLPKEAGVSHGSDQAIWFWGNGNDLTAEEKKVITKAFHEPLSKFLLGEQVDWGTRHPMQLRTLKSNGSVMVEEDPLLEEGLSLWNALEPTWCSI
jgi:carboxylesterase type B